MSRTLLILAPYGLTMNVRDLDLRCKSKKLIVLKMRWECGGLLGTNLGVRICVNITASSLFPHQKMTGTTEMRYMLCEITTEFYFRSFVLMLILHFVAALIFCAPLSTVLTSVTANCR